MPETTPQSVPAEPQVIACDLDETLAYNVQEPDKPFNPFLIGPPIPAMVEKVKNAIANGETVVIFTARLADKENYAKIQQVIRAWTLRHIGVELFSTNEKTPSMKLFLDDKAIGVVPNEGKFKTASTPLSEDKEQVAQALAEAAPYGTVYNRDISEALKSVGLPSRKETTTFKEVAERARELAKVTWESHQNQKREKLKASPEWVSAAEEMKSCYGDEWEEFTSEQQESIIEEEYTRVEEEAEADKLGTEQREERDRIDYENYTKSVAFMDENVEDVTQILEQRGLSYTVQGSNGYSRYITVDLPDEYLTIRVSDHSQPVEIFRGREIPVGGYNEESGERHEAADISIDPGGKTPEDVKRLLEDIGYSGSKTAKEYGDLYHGTTQDFEAFSLEKQSPNSWYGHAFFFTSDYSDAKQYANPENNDLASRLDYMVDKLCENDPKLTRAEALEQAKKEAVGSNPNVKRVRLHMDNPVIVGKGGTVFTRDSKLEAAVRRVARHHGLIFSMDIDMLWKTLTEEILNDNPTFTALEFEMSVRKLDDYVIGHKINHIYQLVVDIYKELGFDGIIMTPRVAFQGRGLKFPAGVKHYVVWDASQITGEGTDKVGSKTAAAPTDSPQFKAWFKNSKVVNPDGSPKVVYHGTGADIAEFKYEFTGIGNDQLGSGFYFTNSPDTASAYTSRAIDNQPKPGGEQANVVPVYLSIQNPIVVYYTHFKFTRQMIKSIILAAPDLEESLSNYGDISYEGKVQVLNNAVDIYTDGQDPSNPIHTLNLLANDFYPHNVKEFNEAVYKVTKFDGVSHELGGETHYVAWFPNQIKSATGNNGEFNPENHRITAGKTAASNKLYHGTSMYGIVGILKDNAIFEGVHWGREGEPHGVRLTRSKQVAGIFAIEGLNGHPSEGAIIELDAQALARDYKLQDYEDVDCHGDKWCKSEKEVVVLGKKIKNICKYITAIYLKNFKTQKAVNNYALLVEGEERMSAKEWLEGYAMLLKNPLVRNAPKTAKFSFDKNNPIITASTTVYHGSPFHFSDFNTDKINSGEGNQTFGWGLYFTDSRGVAEWYKNSLEGQKVDWSYLADGRPITRESPNFIAAECAYMVQQYGPVDKGWLSRECGARWVDYRDTKKRFDRLMKKRIERRDGGQIYSADIPNDDTMLLWDRTLDQQPEKVKAALASAEVSLGQTSNAATGQHMYRELSDRLGSGKAASEYLHSIGVLGIKYLDGDSRSAGVGSYNYVIFDSREVSNVHLAKTAGYTAYVLTPESHAAAPTGFDINDVKIQRGGKDYSNTWFATWNGKRIGWASVRQFGEEELAKDERCIWKSNVLEEYRRAGVATKLYDAVEEYCKTQGWKLVASPPWVLSEDAFGFWKKRNPETLKADSRTWNAPYIGKELQYKGNTVRLTSLSDKGGVAEFLVPQKSTTSWGQEVEHTTTWVPSSVVFEQLGLPNKTASTYEPGLLYRSPETPDRNNDYDPQWDYEVNEQPNPELAKLALEASQRYYNELKANGSIDRWMLGFEVWAVNLSEYNAVGMYVSGTNDFPVILIDLNAHVGYENQISKTINHELKHAIQESKGEDMDEDDAESDDGFKTASSSSFSDWFSGSKVVDSSGNPMVVWHGVKREHIESYIQQGEVVFIPTFEKFNEEGRTEPGIWFSPDKAVASKYGVPVPFYLSIQNPMQEESPLCKKPEGHDGVFRIRGKGEGIQDAWEIAVFSANQIRLAKPVQEGATPLRFTANFLQKLAKSIVEELKNQKLDETVVQNILNTDPTQEKSYSLWLASQLKKKQIRLPEDSNQLKNQLQEFTKIKRSPTFTGAKDINKYSIGDLYEITQKKDVEVSKTQQVKDLIEHGNANAKIVAKEGPYTLFEVTGAEEVTILGSNTNWCTTQLEAAEDNLSVEPIFIGYYQGNPYLQFNSEQCLNKKNEEIEDDKTAYTLLEMGFKHKIKATHFWVALNPNTPPASLALLAKDAHASVRRYVAQNPNTPLDLLALLAKDEDAYVRRYVAEKPNTPLDLLALLVKDDDKGVRRYVAMNPNTPSDLLALLAKDTNTYVRLYVAENPNTPPASLSLLAKDADANVRYNVAKNPAWKALKNKNPLASTSSLKFPKNRKISDHYNDEGYWAGTGNAASGILPICSTTGRICLAWRNADIHQGDCWGTIGGAIVKGLSPVESAKKELAEETGFTGAVKLVPAYVFTDGGFTYSNFLGIVPAEFGLDPMDGGSAGIDFEDETDALEWFTLEDLEFQIEKNQSDFHPGLIALIENSWNQIQQICNKAGNRDKET